MRRRQLAVTRRLRLEVRDGDAALGRARRRQPARPGRPRFVGDDLRPASRPGRDVWWCARRQARGRRARRHVVVVRRLASGISVRLAGAAVGSCPRVCRRRRQLVSVRRRQRSVGRARRSPGDGTETTGRKISAASSPAGVAFAAMAYDAHRQRLVLYGGTDGSGDSVDATWELDVSVTPPVWAAGVAGPGDPGPRSMHAMAYDPVHEYIVMFGGNTESGSVNGPDLTDTWTYDGSAGWVEQTPTTIPVTGSGAAMGFDGQEIVLRTAPRNTSGSPSYFWDGDWHTTASMDAPRAFSAIAFAPPRQLVLFGGVPPPTFGSGTGWARASRTRPTCGPSAPSRRAAGPTSASSTLRPRRARAKRRCSTSPSACRSCSADSRPAHVPMAPRRSRPTSWRISPTTTGWRRARAVLRRARERSSRARSTSPSSRRSSSGGVPIRARCRRWTRPGRGNTRERAANGSRRCHRHRRPRGSTMRWRTTPSAGS